MWCLKKKAAALVVVLAALALVFPLPLSPPYASDGSEWSLMSTGTTEDLSGIWGSSSSDVFAVGLWDTTVRYAPSTEALLDQIRGEVSELRDLDFLEEVECQFITRDEYRDQFVEDLVKDIEEINITQELFVLLDLMEEEQNLYNILLDLYSEQFIGLYYPGAKKLYVISDIEEIGPVEKVTLAHEYTHALQDQHFGLGSLPRPEDNSDLSMAVRSLVEGDAKLLEGDYYREYLSDAERAAYDQQMAERDDEAFEAAPRVVQKQLRFPYTSGLDFVYALWEAGGWNTTNQAFDDPPQSTEQILHPEKYLERDGPQSVTMPDLENALGAGWTQLDSDVLGELHLRVYLETFVGTDEATTAAAGWDGDRYVFLKDTEGRKLLALSSAWDSIADAGEFFDTYIDFVAVKSGGAWTLLSKDEGERWWQTEGLSLYLAQEESEVLIVMAPDETVAGQVLTEFAEFCTAPQADFSASLTQATVGQTIEFSDLSTGGIISWTWDFGDGTRVEWTADTKPEDGKIPHAYAAKGSYVVSLEVSGPRGTDTETRPEYVSIYTAPQAHFSASVLQAVVGQTIEFTDCSTGDITSWAWDFDNDGTVDSTEQSPSYSYETPGKYTVSLTVTGPGGSDTQIKSDYITVEEESEQDGKGEENGEAGGCGCASVKGDISTGELAMGWVVVGLCWGTGYYLVRRVSRRKRG